MKVNEQPRIVAKPVIDKMLNECIMTVDEREELLFWANVTEDGKVFWSPRRLDIIYGLPTNTTIMTAKKLGLDISGDEWYEVKPDDLVKLHHEWFKDKN